MKRYVIVGNGVAAAACVEGIRSRDRDGSIIVISAETHPVYCRPLISYYLEGKTSPDKMDYRPADFYKKNGCRVLYGTKAVGMDPAEKTLSLNSGETLSYDALCVAAGSAPFVPPFKGLDTVRDQYTFMTFDDALALEQATETPKDVLIVGAGLIGLKCAEGLYGRAKSITVCDLSDRVLSSILDEDGAKTVQAHLEKHGLRFLLGNTAERFERNTAFMKNGETVPFDVLVLAVGVKPNVALAKDAGASVERGIAVNEHMQTSLPDVYAAGDCAEGKDISCDTRRVLAIMPNAYLQGHAAGVNMAGGDETFDNAVPMNAIGFFGLHLMTAGSYTGEISEEKTPQGSKKFFTENGLLKGFILIGETQRAGLYTSLIRNKTQLADVDFELLRQTATAAAFPTGTRANMFGGVV
ncbi:MAG: NAD(P)/FAD-dependent oxidoreductase [Clostridia bacterium]|nr:NAD(P)/FAD-dependent oxidoreductase [Clostridia bacterium]